MLDTASIRGSSGYDNMETHGDSFSVRERLLPRSSYINAINYANFEGEPLRVVFKHRIYSRNLTVSALPSPCLNDSLELVWNQTLTEEDLSNFDCSQVLIPDRGGYLSAVPDDYCLTAGGMTLALPEEARLLNSRQLDRYPGKGITFTLMQNGSFYKGNLVDFNPKTFLFTLDESSDLRWINMEEEFQVILNRKTKPLYTGECLITATREEEGRIFHTAAITRDEIRRFKKKKFRGERFELPSPVQAAFTHPLSGEKCIIAVKDISGSGFCMREEERKSVLIPGLILPDMELGLPGGRALKCRVQIIYRKPDNEDVRPSVICGAAILDMNPVQHALLLNFIHQEKDSHAFVCNPVDTSALWKFFFESGFIYPEKYKHLSRNRDRIRELYDKLYTKSPGIARHFIYQEGTHIQGHMSMLRSYEEAWLLHHHAASTNHSQNAGLHVLNQVGSFGNNCHRIKSLHMLYLMCYYREENKFPRRVFGDIARKIGNPSHCSLDTWAYYHIYRDAAGSVAASKPILPEGWSLKKTGKGDLKDLDCFYRKHSNGLLLKAMNLTGARSSDAELYTEYEKAGFNRSIELFSLKKEGEVHGVIMADQSETGLNMSDLTNSIKIFITNTKELTQEIVNTALNTVSDRFNEETRIPVLMFPEEAATEFDIPVEKSYTLWVINMEASDTYFRYLKTLLKIIHH